MGVVFRMAQDLLAARQAAAAAEEERQREVQANAIANHRRMLLAPARSQLIHAYCLEAQIEYVRLYVLHYLGGLHQAWSAPHCVKPNAS